MYRLPEKFFQAKQVMTMAKASSTAPFAMATVLPPLLLQDLRTSLFSRDLALKQLQSGKCNLQVGKQPPLPVTLE